jgi:hypothetical protein
MRRQPAVLAAAVAAGLVALAATASARAGDRPGPRPPAPLAAQADSFAKRITENNLLHLTVTNYGFFGNNFNSTAPSMEYPFGTGFEHLVRAGLWIGARATDDLGDFTGVTTGAVDGSTQQQAQRATEFTPRGPKISFRSSLENSIAFSDSARSESDFITFFDDLGQPIGGTNERHRPLGVSVRLETYSWSFSDFKHIVFCHFVITNQGPPLRDVWLGLYGELASGPKKAYSRWPPEAANSSLGSWFNKKLIGYDDSLRLFREHYCKQASVSGLCTAEFDLVPYWAGIKLLGIAPGSLADTSRKVTLAVWNYDPDNASRDQDVERYGLMSAGTIADAASSEFLPNGSQGPDPVELLATGPFPQVAFGDSLSVDFALLCAGTIPDLQRYARFAQRAFDLDYIVPRPPPSPIMHLVPRDTELDIYWDDSPERAVDPTSELLQDFEGYRVYLSENSLDIDESRHLIAQFDLAAAPHDTVGFNTGLTARLPSPVVVDGDTMHYRHTVRGLRNGFKYWAAVTSYDLGDSRIESLESGTSQNKKSGLPNPSPSERPGGKVTVYPNPYRVEARWDQGRLARDHFLWFTNLPERCTIRIYTLSGDLVFETDFDGGSYRGESARGVYDPRGGERPPELSGRSFAWNLITRSDQAAATGLYLYSVEDRDSKGKTVGKFLIVKSDREKL